MSVNLENCKVIDAHTHPFTINSSEFVSVEEYLEKLSLSVSPNMFQGITNSSASKPIPNTNMWMQLVIRALARKFECNEDIREIVEKRNELTTNYSRYVQELFQEVNMVGGIYDFGYPQPPLDLSHFEEQTQIQIWEITRIEPIMVSLAEDSLTFEEFTETYRSQLRDSLQKGHVVGLKSIIAYRSGLEIGAMDQEQAKKSYELFLKDAGATAKEFRDYCLHIAMEECDLSNKVMHIHTGIGDGDIKMSKSSPTFLLDMLRMEKYQNTKVHLVHGGYPWMEEAAFITSILPNVYMDISLQNPFSGHGVERIISQVFEFAPFNKVLYGSDAFTVPEMNWYGIKLFIECFENVLKDWVAKDFMDEEKAQEIGEMVLYKNFENIYGVTL